MPKTQQRFDELCREIGSLILAFGQLEAEVVNCLSLVCNESDHEVGRILGDILQLKGSIRVFEKIAGHSLKRKQGALQNLKKLCKEIEDLADLRNAVVHAEWHAEMEGEPKDFIDNPNADHPFRIVRTPVRRRKATGALTEPSEIRALHERCTRAWSDLITFEREYLC